MILITAKAQVTEKDRAAFLAIAETQVTNSRKEPGCLSYTVSEDILAPGTFLFAEEWADQAAVEFHFAQDYCLAFMKQARKLAPGRPDMKIRKLEDT